jgi:hypothetical protein
MSMWSIRGNQGPSLVQFFPSDVTDGLVLNRQRDPGRQHQTITTPQMASMEVGSG